MMITANDAAVMNKLVVIYGIEALTKASNIATNIEAAIIASPDTPWVKIEAAQVEEDVKNVLNNVGLFGICEANGYVYVCWAHLLNQPGVCNNCPGRGI